MRARGEHRPTQLDPFGVVTSFKSVLLEGLEVAFIVITFGAQANDSQAAAGAQPNGILVAALGAAGALVLVRGHRRRWCRRRCSACRRTRSSSSSASC